MPLVNNSANMNMPIPVVGTDPGPDWADNLNASLTIVDAHDHSSGSGVQITPAGLNINADLDFLANNAIDLRSARLNSQSAVLSLASDLGCLFNLNGDLYWNSSAGDHVQITSGASIVGAAGTITGLPSGTAGASYSSGVFTFQSATNTGANIDGASFVLRNNTVSSFGLTLQPPNAMAADYSLTLPALPGSGTRVMTLDSSGNMAASSVQLPSLPTNNENILQITNTGDISASLAIVSVKFNAAGVLQAGSGATAALMTGGSGGFDYIRVTFTVAFSTTPVIVVSKWFDGAFDGQALYTSGTSSSYIDVYNATGGYEPFSLIAIGTRA